MRAARSEQEKLEDNYRAELRAQTKLVDLYRQHGEENTAKTDELSRALTDLQQLLKGTVSQDFILFFVYFFGGLEGFGHSFANVAHHFVFCATNLTT